MTSEKPLHAALIQFQISDDTYFLPGNFEAAVRKAEETCSQRGNPDLIVFPEYTCVFLALSPFAHIIRDKKTSTEAIQAIMAARGIADVKSIFTSQSAYVEAEIARIFGDMAKRRKATVIAGTYFAAEAGNIKNRAVVFGPDGDVIYTQDKVFLTPMEKDIFQITPGDINKATGFQAAGRRMVLTICRDSLEPVWTEHYQGEDFRDTEVWIDIKANGEVFTYAVEESFPQFMPARLAGTDIPYGLTVCLTGAFLEFFWEGESSAIKNNGGQIEVLDKATSATEPQVLFETLR